MAKETQKEKIYMAMKDILTEYPGGVRAKELVHKIEEKLPEALPHSIHARISDCASEKDDIVKERRKGEGVFFALVEISSTPSSKTSNSKTLGGKTSQKTLKAQVYVAMKDILAGCPGGMRAKELKQKINEKLPEALLHSIGAQMSDCANQEVDIVKEQRKGKGVFYSLAETSSTSSNEINGDGSFQPTKWLEKDFYASFAKYLTYSEDDNDDDESYLNECTKAIAIGGNKFGRDEWLTPDVIGVFKPLAGDNVQFPHEIISAEIKATPDNPIKALGQACAYRLFSHKVYLAMPKPLRSSDRLEALCHIFGIGLVYFDANADKITSSIYEVKFLAQRHTPDMDFVNSVIPEDVIDQLYGQKRRARRSR